MNHLEKTVPTAEPPTNLVARSISRPVPKWLRNRDPLVAYYPTFACDRENRWYFVGYFPEPAIYGEGPDAAAFRQVLAANKVVKVYRYQKDGEGKVRCASFEVFVEPGVEGL